MASSYMCKMFVLVKTYYINIFYFVVFTLTTSLVLFSVSIYNR